MEESLHLPCPGESGEASELHRWYTEYVTLASGGRHRGEIQQATRNVGLGLRRGNRFRNRIDLGMWRRKAELRKTIGVFCG